MYEFKEQADRLKSEIRTNGNFIEEILLDHAFRDANHKYLSNQIKIISI